MKPFRTFTKSFAKEEVTEKNLALPWPEMARTGYSTTTALLGTNIGMMEKKIETIIVY